MFNCALQEYHDVSVECQSKSKVKFLVGQLLLDGGSTCLYSYYRQQILLLRRVHLGHCGWQLLKLCDRALRAIMCVHMISCVRMCDHVRNFLTHLFSIFHFRVNDGRLLRKHVLWHDIMCKHAISRASTASNAIARRCNLTCMNTKTILQE